MKSCQSAFIVMFRAMRMRNVLYPTGTLNVTETFFMLNFQNHYEGILMYVAKITASVGDTGRAYLEIPFRNGQSYLWEINTKALYVRS